jgi:hypothetical protein
VYSLDCLKGGCVQSGLSDRWLCAQSGPSDRWLCVQSGPSDRCNLATTVNGM